MNSNEFKNQFDRPNSLSDPFCEFAPDTLKLLLQKADCELCWIDYKDLLGPYLPAGTYEEAVYFLPLAFDYLLENVDEALDLVTSLAWFASNYAIELERDGVLQITRNKLASCLKHWTCEFTVLHFDEDACREKGWGLTYFDYVQNSETVIQATEDLVRFETHLDLAVSFYAELSSNENDPLQSAWFLEFARALAKNDVYKPPEHPAICKLLQDDELIARHSAMVRCRLASYDENTSYWLDTFAVLPKDQL